MMAVTLDVQCLVKEFSSGRPAVDQVSFQIPTGEITVLLGPSGCGKTTTLRCVAGLEHPTAGQILIDGQVVSAPLQGISVAPRHREVGMVFQSYAVWPHMTVKQNVAYPLKHRGIEREVVDQKVKDALELVDLLEYADRPATSLSGGQMQRVALARSLSYQPKILLLDEPLSNLDAKLRLRLRADLRRIIKQAGLTALYVTHDQSEAVVLGDQIGVMNQGKLLQMGAPQQIYNQPSDLFVASFTGASNALHGTVVNHDGVDHVVELAQGAKVRARCLSAVSQGQAVVIAVRPENIVLTVGATQGSLPVRVRQLQFLGVQTNYEIEVFGQTLEVTELGTLPRFEAGAAVFMTLPPEQCWGYPA